MSDEIRIELERTDRAYQPGDVISGRVHVTTDKGDKCQAVKVERFWRTHGRGNRGGQAGAELVVHQGPLPPGESHTFPFEFEVPAGPFTYRGEILNVSHYVKAVIDIPWAFDPTAEVEFGLVPGPDTPPPPGDLIGRSRKAGRTGRIGKAGLVIGLVMAVVGVFFITSFVGIFFLAFAALMLWSPLRKMISSKKLGSIHAKVEPEIAPPGARVRAEVRVRPPKSVEVNEVTATLRCREICVSGHGTDRTTHRETRHSDRIRLDGPEVVPGGAPTGYEGEFVLPEIHAYTFAAKDNNVVWDVEFHVDIPSWPDWKESRAFVVWPGAGFQSPPVPVGSESATPGPAVVGPEPEMEPVSSPASEMAAEDVAAAGAAAGAASAPSGRSVAEPEATERPSSPPPPEPTPEVGAPASPPTAPAEPTPPEAPAPEEVAAAGGAGVANEPSDTEGLGPDAPELARRVHAILSKPRVGGGRHEVVQEMLGREYDFELVIEESERSFGVPAQYRDGRTVTGKIRGTDVNVEVRFPPDRNEEVDALSPGDALAVSGKATEWESLRSQPLIEA